MENKKRSKGSDYLVQGSILAAAGILVRMIGLIYRVPITNILGDEGNGYYNIAYSVYNMLLMISSFGLPIAVSKLVSTQMVLGRKKNAIKVFKSAVLFALVVGGVISVITFIFAQSFANILGSPPGVYALRVIAPTLFVMAILGAVRGYFQGLGTMLPTAFSQIVEGVINAVVSVIAAHIFFNIGVEKAHQMGDETLGPAYGAAGSTLGTLVSATVALVFFCFILYAYRGVLKKQQRQDAGGYEDSYKVIYKALLITIVPIVLSTVTYNINELLDVGIFNNIMKFKGFEEKAISGFRGVFYGKVKLLTNVPLIIASCLIPSMIPSLSDAMVNRNKKLARDKIHMSMRYTLVVTIPCAVGLGVLASPVLQLLFKDSSALAANLLILSCFTLVFYSYSTIQNGALQGINRLKVPVVNALIAIGIHLVFLLLLLVVFNGGIYAVAIADFIFAISMCVLNARALGKYLQYQQEQVKTFVIPGVCSLIMGIVVLAVYKVSVLLLNSNAIGTVLAILIGAVVYAVLLLKFKGITKSEIRGIPKGRSIIKVAEKLHLF